MQRNTQQQWGQVSRYFHWGMALIIIIVMILGWCAESWRLSPLKLDLFVWHKSVGMLILVLVILRVLWRLMNATPELLSVNRWERLAARLVQAGLYVLMVLLPVSGWVITSAANIPVKLFWWLRLPPLVEPDKSLELLAKQVHGVCLTMLILLLMVHIGAAWRHHFILRNNILKRMLGN